MAQVMNTIISAAQNAFLGGRNMADNINLLQELLRHYKRKTSSPNALSRLISEKRLTLFGGPSCVMFFFY
jgi:hypothetical protein